MRIIAGMNENISFRRLGVMIKSKGYSVKEMAGLCELVPTQLSSIINGRVQPLTDVVAKLCYQLKCYPSEIVSFDGIVINEKYFTDDKREKLPVESSGLLTYSPFWFFLKEYLEEVNKGKDKKDQKDHNDLFNLIEPPRRKELSDEQKEQIKEAAKKSLEARYGKDHQSKRAARTDYSKGLPLATRSKLRNDKPLNLSVIYEICKFLGCSIDFVIGYK